MAEISEERLAKLMEAENKLLEQKNKALTYGRRVWAEQHIILEKAKKKGITASEAEIDAYLAVMKKKK